MINIILLLNIIICCEILNGLKYFSLLKSLLKLIEKSRFIVTQNKISDHWKEKIIPIYSLKIMRLSFYMLLIFLIFFFLFYFVDIFVNDFLNFLFSVKGIFSSIIYTFLYLYIKRSLKK